jgi:hypothetical protein
MIFGVGLWTFLRALFLEPATVALENLALRHQLRALQPSRSPTTLGASGLAPAP